MGFVTAPELNFAGPPPPTNLSAVNTELNIITVTWVDLCDNRNCNANRIGASYEILYKQKEETFTNTRIANMSSKTVMLTNIQTNAQYLIEIRIVLTTNETSSSTRSIQSDKSSRKLVQTRESSIR